MKTNTISTYLLVCLLTRSHWNLLVPVRAGEGGGTGAGAKTGVDLNIKSDTKTKDNFSYNKVGSYVTYIAKGDKAFQLVKDDKIDVWKASDANSYSGRVEVEFLANEGKVVTICLADNKTKLFKKDGKDKPWKEMDLSKVIRSSINISFPYESYFYKNELKGNLRTFTAKKGFVFNVANDYVAGNKVEVWKTTNESEYTDKIQVEHMSDDSKAVVLCMGDDKTRIFLRSGTNKQWSEIDLTKVNPNSVNIGYEHDSYFYTNKLENGVRTFTAKKGFAFKGANDYIDGDKYELWKTDCDKEYSTMIVKEGNKVTIHLPDGTTKMVEKGSDRKWPSGCLGPKTGIFLSLKVKQGTSQFNYKKDGKVVTFTPRGNKGFKSVKTGNTVVWSTDKVSEYATKVVLDGKGKKEKKITIYLPNNTTKVYKRDGKGKPWHE